MTYILILYSDLGLSPKSTCLKVSRLTFYELLIFSMRATSRAQTIFNDLIIRAH
jgi:hypothetical protein